MFLCIGFVQAHKGFDRAVRAFSGLAAQGARLDVVGSVRLDDQQTGRPRRRAAPPPARDRRRPPPLRVRERRAAFDRWIVAADTVVLPYRHIWSSSVAERATLLGRPVIATNVGGLADQVGAMPGAVLVDDNTALAAAMARALGGAASAPAAAGWPVDGGVDRRTLQDAVEHARRGGAGRTVRGAAGTPGQRRRFAAPSRPAATAPPAHPAGARVGPAGRQRAEAARPPGHRVGGRPTGRPAQRAPAGDHRGHRRADATCSRTRDR